MNPYSYLLILSLAAGAASCASSSPLGASAAAPALESRIHGRIVDLSGTGLDNVVVETEPPTDKVLTLDGYFELKRNVREKALIQPGKYQLRVTKLAMVLNGGSADIVVDYPGGPLEVPVIRMRKISEPDLPEPDPLPLGPDGRVIEGGEVTGGN